MSDNNYKVKIERSAHGGLSGFAKWYWSVVDVAGNKAIGGYAVSLKRAKRKIAKAILKRDQEKQEGISEHWDSARARKELGYQTAAKRYNRPRVS